MGGFASLLLGATPVLPSALLLLLALLLLRCSLLLCLSGLVLSFFGLVLTAGLLPAPPATEDGWREYVVLRAYCDVSSELDAPL
eukprot:1158078-Pelagomonas_calceolata.AAC.2